MDAKVVFYGGLHESRAAAWITNLRSVRVREVDALVCPVRNIQPGIPWDRQHRYAGLFGVYAHDDYDVGAPFAFVRALVASQQDDVDSFVGHWNTGNRCRNGAESDAPSRYWGDCRDVHWLCGSKRRRRSYRGGSLCSSDCGRSLRRDSASSFRAGAPDGRRARGAEREWRWCNGWRGRHRRLDNVSGLCLSSADLWSFRPCRGRSKDSGWCSCRIDLGLVSGRVLYQRQRVTRGRRLSRPTPVDHEKATHCEE
jgi:hypothetical protein